MTKRMTQIEVGVDIFMMESCINTAASSIETKHPADIGGLWKFPSLVIVENFVTVGIYHHPKTFPVDEKGKRFPVGALKLKLQYGEHVARPSSMER